jgi:PAS domain S-box-containing protein
MPVNHCDYQINNILSELQQEKEALIASKTDHRNLIDYMQNGYAYCRVIFEEGAPVDFIHEEVNAGYEKLTGLKNVTGRRATEVFPDIDKLLPEFIQKHATVAQTGIADRFELYFEPLASWFDISVYCPQKGYFVAILDDITKRKKAEEAVRESENRFRVMFEKHSACMMVIDPDTGDIIDANHAAANFYGWSIDKLRQMRIQEINTLCPEIVLEEMKKCKSSKQNQFSFRHRKADNSVCDVDVFSNTFENADKILLYTIVHDITERKRYESVTAFRLRLLQMAETHSVEELLMATLDKKEGDQSINALFDAFPQPMLLLDREGTILYVNKAFSKQFNNQPEITPGSNIYHLLSPEHATERKKKITEALYTGERLFYENEYEGRIYRHTIYPLPNMEGEITNLLIFIMDVTTLNLTDKDLLDQKVRYRNLFNNQLNGFAYCRMIFKNNIPVDFIHEVVNLNFKKLTGFQNIEGQKISDLIPGIRANSTNRYRRAVRRLYQYIKQVAGYYGLQPPERMLRHGADSHENHYYGELGVEFGERRNDLV